MVEKISPVAHVTAAIRTRNPETDDVAQHRRAVLNEAGDDDEIEFLVSVADRCRDSGPMPRLCRIPRGARLETVASAPPCNVRVNDGANTSCIRGWTAASRSAAYVQ
jgi:hypothetical protein